MANNIKISLSLSFLLLFHGCLAFQPFQQQQQQNECQIQRINAVEPNQVIQAEAGYTEFFDANEQQFRCAGVEVIRHHIQPQGLLLPSYVNTPLMVYILQGRGYQGIMFPGCPETYQSSQQVSQESFGDRHQKIRHFRQGDVIVIPTGAPHWMYNDGQEEIVAVVLLDSTNAENQLDQFHRRFFLAGNPQQGQKQQQHPEEGSANIFRGFDLEILQEAFNVDQETAQRLQSPDDNRGHIVKVERGLQVVKPPTRFEQQEYQQGGRNGIEETVCSATITANINDVSRADFFNPQAGWCSNLNSFKLPILQMVQLSAERGVLNRNAVVSPYWVTNAHSIIHVTQGNMRMQIVNHQGQAVFDDQIQEGQIVVVPQNFAVAKRAGEQGCQWISFRTNDNAMVSSLAGRTSAIRAMPLSVLANAFRLSEQEAWSLKNNRQETMMFSPISSRPY
uniref:11S globulin seed storage protein 1-like n=1 Tax=Erigeron canadensis TaxID=72917 RepID=UPI001CB97DFA|nr:11S globulin seed storage protein 1-like [Erigeron canadensis]